MAGTGVGSAVSAIVAFDVDEQPSVPVVALFSTALGFVDAAVENPFGWIRV